MEFEFDKEIDALLRRARSGEAALAGNRPAASGGLPSVHLDADDISAFAENALPEKTKILYTAHLADCPRCRNILSNIISLNAEAESQAASSAVTAPENIVAAAAEIPWYRKLFVFPQLTYAMGGLVLIFSGFLVYFVLQSSRSADNLSISQMKERPQGISVANSGGAAYPAETSQFNSNSAGKVSNAATLPNTAATNAATNSASPAAMANASNTSLTEARKELSSDRERTPEATPAPVPAAAPPPPPPATMSDNQTAAGSVQPRPSLMQNQPVTAPDDIKSKAEEDTRDGVRNDKRTTDEAGLSRRAKSAPKPAEKKMDVESRQSGGRNFTRKNGVWYDDNYKGQPTTNVSSNSDDYKKLDAGLRSIAAGFSGTVVIVSSGKAYRIQ